MLKPDSSKMLIAMAEAEFELKKLAVKSGVSVNIVYAARRGYYVKPCYLGKIAKALGVTNCGWDIYEIGRNAFNGLPCGEKHWLAFALKDGEFLGRILFWKAVLRSAMSLGQYRTAAASILHWYIHIKYKRLAVSMDSKGGS